MSIQDDSEFLDALVDTALRDLEDGDEPRVEALVAGRPHLAGEVSVLLRTLRDVAVAGVDPRPRLPGFTIRGEVGHGGMGRVFLASQDGLGGRPVALKVWRHRGPGGGGRVDAAVERLRAEASVLARVRHAGVVTVYDVIAHEDAVAIAMEWVDGTTLQGAIDAVRGERGGAVRLDAVRAVLGGATPAWADLSYTAWVCGVGVQIARALGAAHRAGVLHRDVKPSNILIRRDGVPLLSDFGLAALVQGDRDVPRGFSGTVCYAAPEQLAGREIDGRSDVYGLGATLFHALSRVRPHEIDGASGIVGGVSRRRAPPLRGIDARVPQDLESIIGRAMADDPNDRYASADELADDLERLLRLEPVRARPSSATYSVRKFVERHRLAVGAAVTVVAALAIGLAAALFGLRSAVASRERADASLARSRASQYVASIQAASAYLGSDDTALAARQLEAAPPELRGWEWRYLHSQLDGSEATIRPLGAGPRTEPADRIAQLAMSPDGGKLAVISTDGRLAVIELAPDGLSAGGPGFKLNLREGTDFLPVSLLWHANGGTLLIGERFGPHLWSVDLDLLTITSRLPLGSGTHDVRLAANRTGELLAVYGERGGKGVLQIRSAADDAVVGEFEGERINRAEFVGDGERIIIKGDREAAILEWRTGVRTAVEVRVDGFGQGRDDMAVSPEGSLVAFASPWITQVWSLSPLRPVATLAAQSSFKGQRVEFSRDGTRLFMSEGPRVRGWDVASTKMMLAGRSGVPASQRRAMCVSPDGRRLYTGHEDASIRVWRTDTPSEPTVVPCAEGGAIDPGFAIVAGRSIEAQGDRASDRIVLCSADSGGVIEAAPAGSREERQPHCWFDFSADGKWLFRLGYDHADADGVLTVREVATGETHERKLRFAGPPIASGQGRLVGLRADRAVVATDRGVELIALPSLETLRVIPTAGAVAYLDHARAQARMAILSTDEAGTPVLQIRGGPDYRLEREARLSSVKASQLGAAALSPDGSLLVTVVRGAGGRSSSHELSDAQTGELLDTWMGPSGFPGVAFDPTGTRLAVGLLDGTVRVLAIVPMPPRGRLAITEVLSLRADSWMMRPSFSDDGSRLGCGTVWPSNRLVIWDARFRADRQSAASPVRGDR